MDNTKNNTNVKEASVSSVYYYGVMFGRAF